MDCFPSRYKALGSMPSGTKNKTKKTHNHIFEPVTPYSSPSCLFSHPPPPPVLLSVSCFDCLGVLLKWIMQHFSLCDLHTSPSTVFSKSTFVGHVKLHSVFILNNMYTYTTFCLSISQWRVALSLLAVLNHMASNIHLALLRDFQTFLNSSCAILHPHWECTRVPSRFSMGTNAMSSV